MWTFLSGSNAPRSSVLPVGVTSGMCSKGRATEHQVRVLFFFSFAVVGEITDSGFCAADERHCVNSVSLSFAEDKQGGSSGLLGRILGSVGSKR